MNLLSAAERLAAIDRSKVVLHTESCLHMTGKFSTCQACITICPAEAILAGKPPKLEAEKCQSCMACLPVCPTGAFTADDVVPNLLNCAARIESKSIELLCEHHPRPKTGLQESTVAIRIKGCLAGIGIGGYFGLLALGLVQVVVRDDACAECPWGELQSQIKKQIASAQNLLSAWGRADALRTSAPLEFQSLIERPVWEASNPPLSRRDLFRLASQRTRVAAARAISGGSVGQVGKHPGRERRRMNEALKKLLEHKAVAETHPMGEYGYATLSVSEACSACGVCAHACPTGALRFQENEKASFLLNLASQDCIGCELCVQLCSQQAISVDHQPNFAQVFNRSDLQTLRQGDLALCDRCNMPFAAALGGKYCPTCDYRIHHPFGVHIQPGLEDLQKLVEKHMHEVEEK